MSLRCLPFPMSVQEVKAAILEDMVRLGKEGGLKSFEQVLIIQQRYQHISVCELWKHCCTPLTSGEGHLHPQWDVLHWERPAHSNAEGQEERNAPVLQIPDRRAVRWNQNVDEENGRTDTKALPKAFKNQEKGKKSGKSFSGRLDVAFNGIWIRSCRT